MHDWDDGIEDAEPTVRRRKRRPTLTSMKCQAVKANIPVAAYGFDRTAPLSPSSHTNRDQAR